MRPYNVALVENADEIDQLGPVPQRLLNHHITSYHITSDHIISYHTCTPKALRSSAVRVSNRGPSTPLRANTTPYSPMPTVASLRHTRSNILCCVMSTGAYQSVTCLDVHNDASGGGALEEDLADWVDAEDVVAMDCVLVDGTLAAWAGGVSSD